MGTNIIITGDGSHTLYVRDLDEHYHSVHGAIQESRHVFINAGLNSIEQKQINILEVGFGTGLNALLTFVQTLLTGKRICYYAYEPYPLPAEIWQKLNYPSLPDYSKCPDIFSEMHRIDFNAEVLLSKHFSFMKMKEKIGQAVLKSKYFNLIYFDAFAPAVQPELWTFQVFEKLFEATAVNGVLVTYSAMGEVRRNMMKAGYAVERLAGPPGKREMLRAKNSYRLAEYCDPTKKNQVTLPETPVN